MAYAGNDLTGPGDDAGYVPGQGTSQAARLRGNLDVHDRMDRDQGLAQAAANKQTYQLDWTQANDAAMQASEMRDRQRGATDLSASIAMGGPSMAQHVGQDNLQRGAQMQQGAAMSARGGSLSQAAAMRQQQGGQAAYMQAGNQQLDAQHAQEMAAARGQWMQGASATRQGDMQSQQFGEQQAQAQQKLETSQRALNAQGEMGYEGMAQDEAKSALQQAVHRNAMQSSADAAHAENTRQENARFMQKVGAAAGAGGAFVGSVYSDERTKGNVVPLYEDAGTERHWDRDVPLAPPASLGGASLSAPAPRYSSAPAAKPALASHAPAPPPAAKPRKLSDAELKRLGEDALAMQRAGNEASLAQGSSVRERGAPPAWLTKEMERRDPMGAALADMKPYQYEYKPQYGGLEGQAPGEKNVGPMAQDMAKNPITGSALTRDPNGLLKVDTVKAGKLSLGAIGYLASKQQQQDAEIAQLKGRR